MARPNRSDRVDRPWAGGVVAVGSCLRRSGPAYRVWVPILITAYQGQFVPAYRWAAWLCWVRMTRTMRAVASGAWLAAAGVACANATTREARIPGARDDCEAAAVQVANKAATAETFKALAWCDETGPTALAATWHSLPADTIRLRTFLFASANIRDGRLFSAAHATAIDSNRRARERAAALVVLVAQVDSTATVTVVPASRKEVWRAQLARGSHASQIAGTKPLPSDAHERVNALVQRIAVGVPSGAAGLRDPLGIAVQAARLDLKRVSGKTSQRQAESASRQR